MDNMAPLSQWTTFPLAAFTIISSKYELPISNLVYRNRHFILCFILRCAECTCMFHRWYVQCCIYTDSSIAWKGIVKPSIYMYILNAISKGAILLFVAIWAVYVMSFFCMLWLQMDQIPRDIAELFMTCHSCIIWMMDPIKQAAIYRTISIIKPFFATKSVVYLFQQGISDWYLPLWCNTTHI